MDHEHFAVSPDWKWYILLYFFLAGIAGGAYVIGALLRLAGGAGRDRAAERVAFLVAFPVVLICPILLTLDLGSPGRFWHMLINTTPGQGGVNFVSRSPMSVGVWALSLFALVSFVTFVATLSEARGGRGAAVRLMAGAGGSLVVLAGALLGLFVASYTGVLLSVSNQAVWSDTWTLGGLFLASGMSAAAVVVAQFARRRAGAGTERRLAEADGWFAVVELLFVVLFFITLGAAGTAGTVLGHGWALLWVVVGLGLLVSLLGLARRGMAGAMAAVTPVLVVLGVFALRAVIIFSPQ
ncbi:MAG: polysulfide reductase [Chloroflexi bacterium]|nr:MAG: polysulfide reductase [Chloroflexota bacterium]